MYFYGFAISKDDAAAVDWWRKAAEQGNVEAQYNLGYAYARGAGVERDDATAYRWFAEAAAQGDVQAQTVLRRRELERLISTARQWEFKEDMNGDGAVTISDIRARTDWLLFYPGDIAVSVLLQNEGLARFLELTPDDFGGRRSGLVSGLFWVVLGLGSWVVLYLARQPVGEPSPFELFDRDERGQQFEVISRHGGHIRPDVAEREGHCFPEPPQVLGQFDDRQVAWDSACKTAETARGSKPKRWIGVRKVARPEWAYWIGSYELTDWRKRRDSASEAESRSRNT